MPLETLYMYCPGCGHDCPTETPPCPDGHGVDCPDRACLECGTALLLDAQLIQLARPVRRGSARTAA